MKKQVILEWTGILAIGFLIPFLTFKQSIFSELFVRKFILTFITSAILWKSSVGILLYFRKKYPNIYQTQKRILYQSITMIISMLVITIILDNTLCQILIPDSENVGKFLIGFRFSILPSLIISLIYESSYFFEQWKENVRKTEALARENIQSQLETLKNQLDPHFLFNSLNTLAALIDDENQPAQDYLERLSDVYRYVLINREKNTVSLEEEMRFVDAYIFLNKTRFRENLQVEKHINPATFSQQIAPLSLQILIENAIKHNIISKDKPLKIKIFTDSENYIHVENNIQEKRIYEKSTKVGLVNIVNRYQLLTNRKVEISNNQEIFKVKIPILSSI